VLNTILYNRKKGINNEVKKRQDKSAAAIAPRSSIGNNVSAANNDALFDRKIDLITEGIAIVVLLLLMLSNLFRQTRRSSVRLQRKPNNLVNQITIKIKII
jgi:hypothetical protein